MLYMQLLQYEKIIISSANTMKTIPVLNTENEHYLEIQFQNCSHAMNKVLAKVLSLA